MWYHESDYVRPEGVCVRDLLHGLKAVASGHRMTGLPKQDVSVPTRTQREPAAYRRNSRFLPRCRAVARSRRPHRNPCHCRVTNRPCSSPPLVCWGPASHRFRSNLSYVGPREKPSVGHPVRPQSGGFLRRSVRSTPACSLLGSDWRRNTRHSREGGGMRSSLYQKEVRERVTWWAPIPRRVVATATGTRYIWPTTAWRVAARRST